MQNTKSKGLEAKMKDANQKAAVLAFATHLQQQMLPKAPMPQMQQPMQQPQWQSPPQPQNIPESNNQQIEKLISEKIEQAKNEIITAINNKHHSRKYK